MATISMKLWWSAIHIYACSDGRIFIASSPFASSGPPPRWDVIAKQTELETAISQMTTAVAAADAACDEALPIVPAAGELQAAGLDGEQA